MWNLEGRVAIVTGGGNGIGRATAALMARERVRVVVADVERENAGQTAREITDSGGDAIAVCADVTRPDAVEQLVETAREKYGRIDILFANAAVQVTAAAADTTQREWDRLLAVNVTGVFLCCKHVLPIMRAQRAGAIVISASGHAFVTFPNCSAYAATKGALVAFMRGLALDYAADGIRANCIIPGATDTRLVRNFIQSAEDPAAAEKKLLEAIPMRRLAQPEEIAQGVLFLASDVAGYVTGTCLAIDGGFLAQG